ncbi:hypothetical protein B0H13DRAFT_2318332 [Mycena leptocephala]|nr:hypothetical protein B0H13DRAFT_2318332 [Mycena leptocephala]
MHEHAQRTSSPKSTAPPISLAHQHLAMLTIHAILLGLASGGARVRWCKAVGTFGVPLRGLKINFISPPSCAPTAPLPARHPPRQPHLAWRAGPYRAADTLSENTDRDEPPYESADVCGDPWVPLLPPPDVADPRVSALFRAARLLTLIKKIKTIRTNFETRRYTLIPSPSTARLLHEKGWANLRVVGRGVDGGCFW